MDAIVIALDVDAKAMFAVKLVEFAAWYTRVSCLGRTAAGVERLTRPEADS